jgi:hypothetical protein
MVDGKVVYALTNQNTFNICDKSGPEMAKNEGPFSPVSEERLQFGASPLHFGLRAFEALLHIAYKQDVKSFKVQNTEDLCLLQKGQLLSKVPLSKNWVLWRIAEGKDNLATPTLAM